jgi:LCP family protein required for cell wall assembly
MSIYGGKPPKRPRGGRLFGRLPRWARWTLGIVGVILLVIAVGVGYEVKKVRADLGRMTVLTNGDKTASNELGSIPGASQPVNALIIGSDHRADGATGKNGLSDTLMLVRMDPTHHMVSLLSIPRDLWVDIPGVGYSKINGAYSTGGDALALKTVESVTGVKPNYLLNVDFSGFQRLVDTLGGVYVNVDQYYYNPTANSQADGWSEIDIKPGYQLLSGVNALAFSRYRHTDDDFHRQARQQTFLRAFEARASARFKGISITDLPFINDMLDAISRSATIVGPGGHSPSLSTLEKFASTAYSSRSHVVSVHLDWSSVTEAGGASAVQLTNLKQALFQWQHPWLIGAPQGLPGSTGKHHKTPFKPKVTPSSIRVAIVNGSGGPGVAGKADGQLVKWGYAAHIAGNAPSFNHQRTWVYYRAAGKQAAADLVKIFGGTTTMRPLSRVHLPGVGPKADVVVEIGRPFKGTVAIQAPKPPTKPTLPTTLSQTTDYKSDFASAKRFVHFPVLYPSMAQANSTFCPWIPTPVGSGELTCQGTSSEPIRVYNIPAAGSGANSMYAVFFDQAANSYWGIEETKFTKAPLLATPNAYRHLDGRTYRFFFNGSHLQTVSFTENGVAYWVSNTLLDDLTNDEMIAIARSLKPVH